MLKLIENHSYEVSIDGVPRKIFVLNIHETDLEFQDIYAIRKIESCKLSSLTNIKPLNYGNM